MSVKLSNVAHPVSVVAAGVSPQPTSDASIDTASSTATSSGSNARDHAGKQIKHKCFARNLVLMLSNAMTTVLNLHINLLSLVIFQQFISITFDYAIVVIFLSQ